MSRILLIEDDPSSQLLFRTRLEDLGFEVVTESTGARGLMEARKGVFDLFLVDVGLGSGIDGYEVCQRLKATPQFHNVPVVLISGKVKNREELHRGYEAGCESYLVKGDVSLLEDVVRAMLRLKTLQDDLTLQNRLLEDQNRRLQVERERGDQLEEKLLASYQAPAGDGAFRLPQGTLLVDAEGVVRHADRGAHDLLGMDLEGRHLGSIAPDTGLEAYVRDARTESREGYRIDFGGRGGRPRQVQVTVLPMQPSDSGPSLKSVFLLVQGRQADPAAEGELLPRLEAGELREASRRAFHPSALKGSSPFAIDLRRQLDELAQRTEPVLLHGESGTGKGLAARVLHFHAGHRGSLVPFDCAAISPELLEAELFGCVEGAVPGVNGELVGAFREAHGGTLNLSEAGRLPREVQGRVLEVLERSEVTPVGAKAPVRVKVRMIAMTSENPDELLAKGRFDERFLALMGSARIHFPRLSARKEDVEPLARHFLTRFGVGKNLMSLDDEVLFVLQHHDWPGNIQELESSIEHAAQACMKTSLGVHDLPPRLVELFGRLSSERGVAPALPSAGVSAPPTGAPPKPWEQYRDDESDPVSLKLYERKAILRALRECQGDKLAAAKLLEIGKSTFYRKLHEHGI